MSQAGEVWQPGQVVDGRYEVREVVESGGMGVVYRVWHREWDVELAVKTPRPELVGSADRIADFETEAQTWVELGLHPHTVACAYVRRFDGLPRIFAEWIDGGSLAEWIRTRRLYEGGAEPALARILDTAIQFAWGLEHAHTTGVIHQDVKPANALLTTRGVLKVTDFGLARARAVVGEPVEVAGASVLAGFGGMTPAYCSPEQADAAYGDRHTAILTKATDVWSWAVSILEMFLGQPPCERGQIAAEVFEAYRCGEIRAATPEAPAMPPGVADMLRRCLRTDPATRPARIGDLADELVEAYTRETGRPLHRSRPEPVHLRADGLNNTALSMLDLGLLDRAETAWGEALTADPRHLATIYNRGLHRWRTAQLTDDRLLASVEEAQIEQAEPSAGDHLVGVVHLERGDVARANESLRRAVQNSPGNREYAAALAIATALPLPAPPRVLAGHDHLVTAIAFTPDGQLLASGSQDGTTRVWDVATGHCLLVVTASGDSPVRDVAFNPANGELVVAVERSGSDATRSSSLSSSFSFTVLALPLPRLLPVSGQVSGAAPEPHIVAASAAAAVVHVENLPNSTPAGVTANGHFAFYREALYSTLTVVNLLDGHRTTIGSQVSAATGDPSGGFILVGERKNYEFDDVQSGLWELATGQRVRSFGESRFREALAISRDRTRVLLRDDSGLVVANLAKPQGRVVVCRLVGVELSGSARAAVSFSPDARSVVTADGDSGVRLWDSRSGRCLRTFTDHTGEASAVAISPDDRLVVSGGVDGAVRVWDMPESLRFRAPWAYQKPRAADELRSIGRQVDATREEIQRLVAHGEWASAAEQIRCARREPGYERDRDLLDLWHRVGSHGRRTRLSTMWRRAEIRAHDRVFGVQVRAISSDGRLVLYDPGFGGLRVWDVADRRDLHSFAPADDKPEFGPAAAMFSPDGRLVRYVRGRTAQVWDMSTGRQVHSVTCDPDFAFCGLSPDGGLAVALPKDPAAQPPSLEVWDIADARRVGTVPTPRYPHLALPPSSSLALSSHAAAVTGQRFGFDSRSLEDGRIGVFDLTHGREVVGLTGHTAHVTSMTFTSDGQFLTSFDVHGNVRVWDVAAGRCVHQFACGHSVISVAVSRDGLLALTGDVAGNTRLWDIAAGVCLHEQIDQAGHSQFVLADSGHHAVTGNGLDQLLSVWEFDWDYEFVQPVAGAPAEPSEGCGERA